MTGKIIYDTHFNANEWFVSIGLLVGLILMWVLPNRFPRKLVIIYFTLGVTFGALSDHYIGTVPVSFYDTSDTSVFDLADVPSIIMYGAYTYLFFYLYDLMKIKNKFNMVYILSWSFTSTMIEWVAVQLGVFHYLKGYWLGISFTIYLLVHSSWVLFFHLMKYVERREDIR